MPRLAYHMILLLGLGVYLMQTAQADDRVLRAGMIGLDTSHVPTFTKIFNAENPAPEVAGLRIVAGYPGGTDLPLSRDRVAGFTEDIRGMGVEIVSTIPELLDRVDVAMIQSVDGRIHLQEARQVIAAGKPLFIDKPIAGSLIETIMIFELAERAGVPVFSSSSLRFGDKLLSARSGELAGPVAGCDAWGSCSYLEGTPDLFFYGIHGVEGLFTVMGTGCTSVARTHTEDTDLVVGVWDGGRIGTYRGIRNNAASFGFLVFGKKGIVQADRGEYQRLCAEIARFFKTGISPVPSHETIEVIAFLEAADESRKQGGAAISLPEFIEQARAEAHRRLASEDKQ